MRGEKKAGGSKLIFILSIYLPSLLFASGESALMPSIPLSAHAQGAGAALAGIVASSVLFGVLIADLPNGLLVIRLGEQRTMLLSAALSGLSMLLYILLPFLIVLTISSLLTGFSLSAFAMARHSFMTVYTPLKYRARALSLLGGTFRAGTAIGPLLASLLIGLTGSLMAVFWFHLAVCVVLIVLLLVLPDPASRLPKTSGKRPPATLASIWSVVKEKKKPLLQIGTAVAILSSARTFRAILLPLAGAAIALSSSTITFIMGLAGGLEMLLFYFSGIVMDRWGRRWAGGPSLLVLGVSYLGVFLAHNLAIFAAVAGTMALGNALSSGIILTLGADLAGQTNPAPFLSGWRFISDFGQGAGPLAASSLTAVIGIGGAAAFIGLLALLGSGLMFKYLPRYEPKIPLTQPIELPKPENTDY